VRHLVGKEGSIIVFGGFFCFLGGGEDGGIGGCDVRMFGRRDTGKVSECLSVRRLVESLLQVEYCILNIRI
jgi:hypothetical protein